MAEGNNGGISEEEQTVVEVKDRATRRYDSEQCEIVESEVDD